MVENKQTNKIKQSTDKKTKKFKQGVQELMGTVFSRKPSRSSLSSLFSQ